MATLDGEKEVSGYNLDVHYHSSREPDDELCGKLGESLQLARKMTRDASIALTPVIQESRKKKRNYKACHPVAVEAAEYHLKLPEWKREYTEQAFHVIHQTSTGLNAFIVISDVLSLYTTDLYKVYRDRLPIHQAGHLLPGKFRKETAGDVTDPDPQKKIKRLEMEGYVYDRPKEHPRQHTKGRWGSIHIEFSLATIYPRPQMARVIVHEATHKFAGTLDAAYCHNPFYKHLSVFEATKNADSYTYVVLSIYCNQLIKDKEECFRVFPQYGPLEWEHAADKSLYGRTRSKSF